MTEAAFIHTRALGYPEAPLHAALAAGALAVSLSGKGPAIAALAHVGTSQPILAAWHRFGPGWVLRTRPTNTGVLATSRTRHSPCASG
jgi:shikimate kinase